MLVVVQRQVPLSCLAEFVDKVADMPVVVHGQGVVGSDSSENVWRCRRCSSAWLWFRSYGGGVFMWILDHFSRSVSMDVERSFFSAPEHSHL